MEKPWKVIAAFIGVFVAGAVFGAYFSLGVGARWLSKEPPVVVTAPAPVATPDTVAKSAPSTKGPGPLAAALASQRSALLQVPQSWQAPQLLRRYAERLELTPEQKQRIHPLIQRASEDYNRLRQNTFRETAIILERLQQDISQVLTPEQRQKLQEMEERQRDALRRLELKQKEQRKNNRPFGKNGPNADSNGKGQPPAKPESSPSDLANPTAEPRSDSTGTASGPAAPVSTGSEKQE